ncbi:MAG: aminotransferase, partial [Planctomycetota bacterium]
MERKIKWLMPGPVPVLEEVLEAMQRQPIHHRSCEFHDLMGRLLTNLKWLFRTEQNVFVATCSASAVMEAALRNTVSHKALCLVNGAFGQRWFQMARSNGIPADSLHFEPGRPIDAEVVAQHLAKSRYDVVTFVHVETSTGVQNPLEAVAAVVRLHPDTLLLVDAVSSLLTTELDFDALKLDFCLTASQKGLALPPGLAIFAVSERLLERARRIRHRGYYLDFLRFRDYALVRETPNTPAVNLLYALEARLSSLRRIGIGAEIRRCAEMAELCRSWAKKRFSLFPDERFAANSVTVVRCPPSFSVEKLNLFLAKHGFRISDGYGDLKGRTFRISHMGA